MQTRNVFFSEGFFFFKRIIDFIDGLKAFHKSKQKTSETHIFVVIVIHYPYHHDYGNDVILHTIVTKNYLLKFLLEF